MERVWEAPGDKGRTVPRCCPCCKTTTSKDTKPAPKSFSPTHCLWLESQRISQLHCGSLWFSPRPHSRVQTKENWNRKKILHPNGGLSCGPYHLRCQFRKPLGLIFHGKEKLKEQKACGGGRPDRGSYLISLCYLFPQFKNQLVMNFSGNFLNNVISLKICASTIGFTFQVWIRKLASPC